MRPGMKKLSANGCAADLHLCILLQPERKQQTVGVSIWLAGTKAQLLCQCHQVIKERVGHRLHEGKSYVGVRFDEKAARQGRHI
jgi:hypothetical protein